MVQSFENEILINKNTCEVLMNHEVMEIEYEINPSFQIERSQNLESEINKYINYMLK
jgi:hypothetical protein